VVSKGPGYLLLRDELCEVHIDVLKLVKDGRCVGAGFFRSPIEVVELGADRLQQFEDLRGLLGCTVGHRWPPSRLLTWEAYRRGRTMIRVGKTAAFRSGDFSRIEIQESGGPYVG
jgi:hypothetical protein